VIPCPKWNIQKSLCPQRGRDTELNREATENSLDIFASAPTYLAQNHRVNSDIHKRKQGITLRTRVLSTPLNYRSVSGSQRGRDTELNREATKNSLDIFASAPTYLAQSDKTADR
jgi:hypothetical protein